MTTDIKNKVIGIGIPTLIGLIIGAIGIYATYSDSLHNFDTRILKLEQNANKGERFTSQDGKILEQKIDYLEKTKAEKLNMRVIETKLANIEALILELKSKMK